MFFAVGFRSTPKGGFGNRLLNYINLRQLADALAVPHLMPDEIDAQWIAGIHRPARIPWALRRLKFFSRVEVDAPGFLDRARGELSTGNTVIMKPRLLTESLARFDFRPARDLVKHRFGPCESHRRFSPDAVPVVLHLRGSDFASWKPGAILDETYYRDALAYLDSEGYMDSPVRICTEDPDHPAFGGLSNFLSRAGRLINVSCDDPFSCDYASMIYSDRLVSSPSTFAITAGLLGDAQIVHNRSWVQSRIDEGDLFWRKVRDDSLNGYDVLTEI